MAKMIDIEHCVDCPNYDESRWWCNLKDGFIEDECDPAEGISQFCPLSDAPEEQANGEDR